MTVKKGKIDMTNSFAPGMDYVILSRFETFDNFTIMGYNGKDPIVDKRVKEYYDSIKNPKKRKFEQEKEEASVFKSIFA